MGTCYKAHHSISFYLALGGNRVFMILLTKRTEDHRSGHGPPAAGDYVEEVNGKDPVGDITAMALQVLITPECFTMSVQSVDQQGSPVPSEQGNVKLELICHHHSFIRML